jgi:hypothetical protein
MSSGGGRLAGVLPVAPCGGLVVHEQCSPSGRGQDIPAAINFPGHRRGTFLVQDSNALSGTVLTRRRNQLTRMSDSGPVNSIRREVATSGCPYRRPTRLGLAKRLRRLGPRLGLGAFIRYRIHAQGCDGRMINR